MLDPEFNPQLTATTKTLQWRSVKNNTVRDFHLTNLIIIIIFKVAYWQNVEIVSFLLSVSPRQSPIFSPLCRLRWCSRNGLHAWSFGWSCGQQSMLHCGYLTIVLQIKLNLIFPGLNLSIIPHLTENYRTLKFVCDYENGFVVHYLRNNVFSS